MEEAKDPSTLRTQFTGTLTSFSEFFFKKFIWLHGVLVVARRLFVAARGILCGMRTSLVAARGLLSSCGVWAPEHMGSVVALHRLQSARAQ